MKSIARLITIILIVSLTGCGSGGGGSANNGDTGGSGTPTTGVDDIRDDMLAAVNQARSVGRMCGSDNFAATTPVRWNDRIAAAAFKHSSDMAANGFLDHTGSDNSSPGDRLTREGYVWSTYGENLAVGYSSVTAVVQAWLGSAGHCRNIMNPDFDEIGAAYAKGPYMSSPSSTYWTLDLARAR